MARSACSSSARVGVPDPEAAPERIVVEQQLAEAGPQRLDIAQVAEADRARRARPCPRRPGRCRGRWCRAWPGTARLLPRLVELGGRMGRIRQMFSAIASVSGPDR